MVEQPHPHFLVVAYPAQSPINSTLRLAKRLAREASTSARVTFSTAVSAHRRMFPSSADQGAIHDDDLSLSYIPYSDSFDNGFDSEKHDDRDFLYRCNLEGSRSLAAIADDLAARGSPVTCFIYSFFMSWVAGVARARDVPSFFYWIQPATAFAAYWHYFHDHESLDGAGSPSCIVNLPSLPPMRIRDLPSFVSAGSQDGPYVTHFRDMFRTLDTEAAACGGRRPQVLVNTAGELEAPALASVNDKVDLICIGPVLEEAAEGSLIKGEDGYTEWLEKQAEKSVVYLSFGSIAVLRREQVEEIWRGLRESGRPYLWVIRKDSRWEGMELEEEGKGMVVEWCSQERVLAHGAVGCFVTHCGWNSTVESLMCGVPTVAVPQWSDQPTSAWLMEKAWGTGVRVEVGEDGLLKEEELRRCLEVVMGDGGVEVRSGGQMWMERVQLAAGRGGSSDRNLKTFLEEIIRLDCRSTRTYACGGD